MATRSIIHAWEIPWTEDTGGLQYMGCKRVETPETPPSSRAEGLLFLHGLESSPGSSLQTEEEAGLP